jgi:UDP-glucuronate decarboxylase
MSADDGRVVSNFIVQSLRGEPITIYGDGMQTRSFCYVSDLVEGIYRVLTHERTLDSPINLGNPREFTMVDLAEKIISATKSSSKIVFKQLPLDDPKQRKPDISKALEVLKWEPRINLEDGIEFTASYFRSLTDGD